MPQGDVHFIKTKNNIGHELIINVEEISYFSFTDGSNCLYLKGGTLILLESSCEETIKLLALAGYQTMS